MRVSEVFLYDEPAVPQLDLDGLASFLEKTFCVKVTKRRNIFHEISEEVAGKIAASRIFEFGAPFEPHSPTIDEIKIEMQGFHSQHEQDGIIAYDGFEFQSIVSDIIPREEHTLENFHLVFTSKLTCTFDNEDHRYHGRAVIGSNPSIISTTGVIEAPAKPRQYYMDLMANHVQGLNVESIKGRYRGEYLEYQDPRLGKVVEGYAMQALFYYITGKPFCDLLDCRLNNAHWQRDLLYSQIEFGRLCGHHQGILKEWTALNNLNC